MVFLCYDMPNPLLQTRDTSLCFRQNLRVASGIFISLLNNDHFFQRDGPFAVLTACKGKMNGSDHELQMQSTKQLPPDNAFGL